MVDVTRGTLLQQSQNTVIGSVQEERELSSLEKMFDVANKFAYNQHRQEREATAALEGMQMAAAGETLSNIKAGTPLADTLMNIDARAKQAQLYYSNIKAGEVTSTVWEENQYELSKMPPEQATEKVYQLVLEKAKKVAGADGETLNTIMNASVPKISQMYGMQAAGYANHVRTEYNTNQQKDMARKAKAYTKAKVALKNNPEDPVAIAEYNSASQDIALTLVPDPNITTEDWKNNLGAVLGSFVEAAGTTNPDGSYNGMDEIDIIQSSPAFQSLTVEEQTRFHKMRESAERQVVNNLPPDLQDMEIRLKAQARDTGKESAEQYKRRLEAFNHEVKNRLGLQYQAPFNQNNLEALTLDRQGALRTEQQKIEEYQRNLRLVHERARAEAAGVQAIIDHISDNADAYRASGVMTPAELQKNMEKAGKTVNVVDPNAPGFNESMTYLRASTKLPQMAKDQINALVDQIEDPIIPPQEKENLVIRANELIKIHQRSFDTATTADAWGPMYGKILGQRSLIDSGNVTRAAMNLTVKQTDRTKEDNKNWDNLKDEYGKSSIANFFGMSKAPFGKQVLDDNRDFIEADIKAIHKQYNLPYSEEGLKGAREIVLSRFGEFRGNANGMVYGMDTLRDSVPQFQAKQQAYEQKYGKKQMPTSLDTFQEQINSYVDTVAFKGYKGSDPIVKGREGSSRMLFPQRDNQGNIFFNVDITMKDGTHEIIPITQDQILEFNNSEGFKPKVTPAKQYTEQVYNQSIWAISQQRK